MNNDIKEILDKLNKIVPYASVPKELAYMTTNMTPQDCKILLDYITNLQEENEKIRFKMNSYEAYIYELENRIDKAIDKLYCYGEVFDREILQQFQKEELNILQGDDEE